MGKFGKKNTVDLNPLHYNIGLIGESGIGKTTLIKEVCEKLAPEVDGEIGYLIIECGKEDGADAIEGIVYENASTWREFEEIINDIIENKDDYPNLQSVVLDTYDQAIELAESRVVQLHNREHPDKPKISSINEAFGGFGRGLDKAVEILFDKLWELKKVGVNFCIIGHTKAKDIEDPTTGESYQILTANASQRYFNAIKTKLHVLGVAYIDRTIVRKKTGKKDFKGKDVEINKVTSESRIIKFRDDNFSIDSKSRFADIIDEIPMDSDSFIKAIQDAIAAESSKSGKSKTELEAVQKKRDEERAASAKAYSEAKADNTESEEKFEEYLEIVKTKFPGLEASAKTEIKKVMAEYGFKKFSDENVTVEALEKIVEIINNN